MGKRAISGPLLSQDRSKKGSKKGSKMTHFDHFWGDILSPFLTGPGQNWRFCTAIYVRAVQNLFKKGSQNGSKSGQKVVILGPQIGVPGPILVIIALELTTPAWGTPQNRGDKTTSFWDPFRDPFWPGPDRPRAQICLYAKEI